MCNLYSMTRMPEAVRNLFKVPSNRATVFKPLDAIFPGYEAPIIRHADDGERELVMMHWGFILLQTGKAPRRVTNVRDDKILTSTFWKGSFAERRCLVPASSYCEPNGASPAVWNWFAINGDHKRPLFAFPGIWRNYTGPIKKDGENVSQMVYAFMTTEPNSLTASINHERMPVLLATDDQFDTWLNGTSKEAFALARSFPADAMHIVQAGSNRKDLLAA
ncbi:MAG: SOS response-associated peptidase [Hyphomicrobium sp.]|nr:SOS response-associated peptidase [Hyphomicrobium sp.]